MDVRWASAAFMIQVLMVKINGNKMSGMTGLFHEEKLNQANP